MNYSDLRRLAAENRAELYGQPKPHFRLRLAKHARPTSTVALLAQPVTAQILGEVLAGLGKRTKQMVHRTHDRLDLHMGFVHDIERRLLRIESTVGIEDE